MGLLDFLFPTLMAAEYHSKARQQKYSNDLRRDLKRSWEIRQAENEWVEANFTDINAELDLEWYILREPDDDREDIFVYSEVVESLPSYDPSQEELNTYLAGKLGRYNTNPWVNRWGERLALAKLHGKLKRSEASSSNLKISPPCATWVGRERYDYAHQIYHELAILWDQYMRENGFPYKLYVGDPTKDICYTSRRIATPISEAPMYKGKYEYFWGYDYTEY